MNFILKSTLWISSRYYISVNRPIKKLDCWQWKDRKGSREKRKRNGEKIHANTPRNQNSFLAKSLFTPNQQPTAFIFQFSRDAGCVFFSTESWKLVGEVVFWAADDQCRSTRIFIEFRVDGSWCSTQFIVLYADKSKPRRATETDHCTATFRTPTPGYPWSLNVFENSWNMICRFRKILTG